MKFKALIFILFIAIRLNAQKELKIVKIDNSEYPQIEVLIKSNKNLDTSILQIVEKKQKLQFQTSDVPYKEIKQERRILFLINESEIQSIKKMLKDEVSKLKKSDKINIGIMSKGENGKIKIHYMAPEFSSNQQFFADYIEHSFFDFKFPKSNKCKTEKRIQDLLFSGNNGIKNIGIIILGDMTDNDLNFCAGIQRNVPAPIYVLQTKPLTKEKEDKIIAVCMKSGGMFTQSKSDKDGLKVLERYNEDISLDPFNTKSNLKKIIFQISGKDNKTGIKINYGKRSQQFTIRKPKRNQLSHKELFLTIFSSILLIFVLLLLYKCRKNKKKNKMNEKRAIELQPMNITIPIEINIKGKGLNKTYFFEKHLIRIGRNKDNDIVIPDTTVSGNHAIINKQGKEFTIQDLGSTNGVIVNKKKVKKQALKTGSQIKLGGIVMFVRF